MRGESISTRTLKGDRMGNRKAGARASRRARMADAVSTLRTEGAAAALEALERLSPTGATIPPPGPNRRTWIRYQLQQIPNPDAVPARGFNQADIARLADTSEGTVSNVLVGTGRIKGEKAAAVRRITASILNLGEDSVFPEASPKLTAETLAVCPTCGTRFDTTTGTVVPGVAVDA